MTAAYHETSIPSVKEKYTVHNDMTQNTSMRLPVVLCLDVSPSMSLHNRIEDLNRAIETFYTELHNEPKALASVEVAVVTFSSGLEQNTGFEPLESVRGMRFSAVKQGGSNLPLAVLTSIQKIEARIAEVEEGGFDCYLPFLVLVTDGDPDRTASEESLREAVKAVQSHCVAARGEGQHLIAPYVIGVGEEVRRESLDPFAERFTGSAILINERNADRQRTLFQQMFSLIGASVRNSLLGEGDLGKLYERIRKDTMRQASDLIHRVRDVL